MKSIIPFCAFLQLSWTFSTYNILRNENSCPENMVLDNDGKNNSETICKCLDTFLNYSSDNSCYAAYRQGPCPSEHYLIFSSDEKLAKCEKNPCILDGLVPFQGKCYLLWVSEIPCKVQTHHLIVNRNTFQIECSDEPYVGDMLKLKISKSCSKNSMLVPANDNQTEWICGCNPGFLHDVKTNSCHEAYRQGPCPEEYFLVHPPGAKEAKCEKNICLYDRLVPFEDGCYPLYKFGSPCPNNHYLGVDGKTSQLQCVLSIAFPIFQHRDGIITAPIRTCPPGTRRAFNGCKKTFQ